MTDYKQCLKLTTTIEEEYDQRQHSLNFKEDIRHAYQTVQKWMTLIQEEVHPLEAKLVDRKKQVDPITKELRYGPKMLKKIEDLATKIADLTTAIEQLLEVHKESYEKSCKEQEIQELMAQKERQLLENQRAIELQEQKTRELEQQQQLAEQEHQRQVEEEEKQRQVASEATKIRQDRATQRLLEEQQRQEYELHQEELNAGITNDEDGLMKALALLEKNTSAKEYANALEVLHLFCSNICNAPENVIFRQIKRENPHYHQAIGKYEGGHQCLHAFGFRKVQQDDDMPVEYILAEPNLEQDMELWSSWYENLKSLREILEQQLLRL